MGLFDGLFGTDDEDDVSGNQDSMETGSIGGLDETGCDINPATGLPMIGDSCGIDVAGNPFGTDFSSDSLWEDSCGVSTTDDFIETTSDDMDPFV